MNPREYVQSYVVGQAAAFGQMISDVLRARPRDVLFFLETDDGERVCGITPHFHYSEGSFLMYVCDVDADLWESRVRPMEVLCMDQEPEDVESELDSVFLQKVSTDIRELCAAYMHSPEPLPDEDDPRVQSILTQLNGGLGHDFQVAIRSVFDRYSVNSKEFASVYRLSDFTL